MTDDRAQAPLNGTETEMLLGWLAHHRDTLRQKTAGLDAAQLATRLAPSTLTLGGLLKHLALVEDWWFCVSLLGTTAMPPFTDVDWDAAPDWEFDTAAEDSPEELRALYERAVAAADAALATVLPEGLDRRSVRVGRQGQQPSTRWILLHMIEEYARHNGHADLLRESIDGRVGA